MAELKRTVERLSEISRKEFANPYTALRDWPERLDPDQWFTSPEFISLCGTEEYERLAQTEKKRLSFLEAVNFYSLNIHGEKSLIEGLAQRLYRKDDEDIAPYLHHFLDEENKHMVYFGAFCERYAGKIYPDKKLAFPRDYAEGEEDFLFFAKVLVFEEIVDVYNVRMSKDAKLDAVARQINAMHHRDEARHLVFGRQVVKELFQRHASKWPREVLDGVRSYLRDYILATWREYYNADVYRDMAFDDPRGLQLKAFSHPVQKRQRQTVSAGCLRFLVDSGILGEEPTL